MVFRQAALPLCLVGTVLLSSCGEADGTKIPLNSKKARDTGGASSRGGGAGTSDSGRGGSAPNDGGVGGEPGDAGGTGGTGGTSDTGGTGGTSDVGGAGGSTGGTSTTDPGGAGGEPVDPDPDPGMLVGPRDKTVVEGAPYSFEATTAASVLRYQWQRASSSLVFASIPDETRNHFDGGTSTLADDNARFRVLATTPSEMLTSRVATLHVVPIASGALVSLDSGAAHQESHVATLWTSDTYGGSADLGAGTLASVTRTPNGMAGAAAYLSVVFYNNTGATIAVPNGSISARVHGRYMGNPAQSTVSLLCHGILSAAPYAVAGITHQVSINYSNGVVVGGSHTLAENAANNNGRVETTTESMSEVDVDLVLGAFEVPPLGTVWVTFSLTVNSYFGITDFSEPQTLRMTLPEGIDFDTNSLIPLDWVERAP